MSLIYSGPKQQKKFKRLMLNRIKWNELTNKKSEGDFISHTFYYKMDNYII
jgi:hypothetical protein